MGLIPSPGLNLLNTFWPYIVTSITATGLRNGLFIYMMAVLHGDAKRSRGGGIRRRCGPFRTFFQVMVRRYPGLVVVFLFAFVWQWNDYQLITLYMKNQVVLPIYLDGLASAVLGDQWQRAPEEISLLNSAGGLMVIAPLLVLYAVLQRQFVESVERTGIVG